MASSDVTGQKRRAPESVVIKPPAPPLREAGGPSRQGLPAGWSVVLTWVLYCGEAVSPCALGALLNETAASGGVVHLTGGGFPLAADLAGGGAGSTPHVCFCLVFFFTYPRLVTFTNLGAVFSFFFAHEFFLFQNVKIFF